MKIQNRVINFQSWFSYQPLTIQANLIDLMARELIRLTQALVAGTITQAEYKNLDRYEAYFKGIGLKPSLDEGANLVYHTF